MKNGDDVQDDDQDESIVARQVVSGTETHKDVKATVKKTVCSSLLTYGIDKGSPTSSTTSAAA